MSVSCPRPTALRPESRVSWLCPRASLGWLKILKTGTAFQALSCKIFTCRRRKEIQGCAQSFLEPQRSYRLLGISGLYLLEVEKEHTDWYWEPCDHALGAYRRSAEWVGVLKPYTYMPEGMNRWDISVSEKYALYPPLTLTPPIGFVCHRSTNKKTGGKFSSMTKNCIETKEDWGETEAMKLHPSKVLRYFREQGGNNNETRSLSEWFKAKWFLIWCLSLNAMFQQCILVHILSTFVPKSELLLCFSICIRN